MSQAEIGAWMGLGAIFICFITYVVLGILGDMKLKQARETLRAYTADEEPQPLAEDPAFIEDLRKEREAVEQAIRERDKRIIEKTIQDAAKIVSDHYHRRPKNKGAHVTTVAIYSKELGDLIASVCVDWNEDEITCVVGGCALVGTDDTNVTIVNHPDVILPSRPDASSTET